MTRFVTSSDDVKPTSAETDRTMENSVVASWLGFASMSACLLGTDIRLGLASDFKSCFQAKLKPICIKSPLDHTARSMV